MKMVNFNGMAVDSIMEECRCRAATDSKLPGWNARIVLHKGNSILAKFIIQPNKKLDGLVVYVTKVSLPICGQEGLYMAMAYTMKEFPDTKLSCVTFTETLRKWFGDIDAIVPMDPAMASMEFQEGTGVTSYVAAKLRIPITGKMVAEAAEIEKHETKEALVRPTKES